MAPPPPPPITSHGPSGHWKRDFMASILSAAVMQLLARSLPLSWACHARPPPREARRRIIPVRAGAECHPI